MRRLKVVVLGAGFFGKNWLRELAGCGECQVVGLVAKHPDLLAAAGDEFGVPVERRFGSVEEGLDRASADAAIVALPEMAHADAIVAAVERGLHVLTEKPLALTTAEAAVVLRAARRRPTAVVMVDQNYRWRPHTQALRRLVREGKLGHVASVTYEFRQPITRTTTDAWREEMPHPFLHDMAIHHFDLLRAVLGVECRRVMAVGVRPPWSWYRGIPGVDALLSFERGMTVCYSGTMVARGAATPQDGVVTIMGEAGTARLEGDSRVRWYRDREVEAVPVEAMPHADTAYTLREFLAAIRDRRLPETHVEDNIRSLAMVEAAIRSVDAAQPVEVTPLVAAALAAA
jgi:predicted dehydrogenase